MSDDLTSVFRISATLREPVKYSAVREAVELTSARFPYFSVSLGSGIFWHFLEFNNQLPRIQAEEEVPCTAFAVKRKNEPLYRIIVKGKRISVEFSHIITDGGGALEYMKSLLYTYLTLTGKHITSPGNIILPGMPVSEEEYEDAYNKYFQKLPPPLKLAKAWHLPFKLNKKPKLRVLHVEINISEILETARSHKVTLTEYFVSVYLYALHKIFISAEDSGKKLKRKVLRIEVPVNMRKKVSSRTMRNFSLFVLPEIDLRLGNYTFEEIMESVHHQLQISSDIKQISRFLSSNVSSEKLFIVRILPLFVKKIVIAAVYRSLASKRWSGIATNLGVITLPGGMEDMVDSFELIPPPPNPKVKVSCALISYKDKLRICFNNITQSLDLEKHILRHFTDAGIHVKILNNK
jgi:NRPS condensation-like uncharacterized protein